MAQHQDIKSILIDYQRKDNYRTISTTILLIERVCTFITEKCPDSVTGQFISENLNKASEELTQILSQPSCDYNRFHSTLYSARTHLLQAADLIVPAKIENSPPQE